MNKKIATIVIFLIAVNWALVWFSNMGFFDYGPAGVLIEYDVAKYGFGNIVVNGFIIAGLSLLGIIFSAFVKINAFAMIMFVNIFWFPYIKASALIGSILIETPAAFATIEGIFTTIMLFVFALALIEMSTTATTG